MSATWSDADLESFHDDALGPDRRAALADDLRRDNALRARLLEIVRADERIRAALLDETPATSASRRPMRIRPSVALVGAAALTLAAFGAWRMLLPTPVAPASPIVAAPTADPAPDGSSTLARARSDGLLIAVVPTRRAAPLPVAPPAQDHDAIESLLALLDDGRLDEALALAQAQPDEPASLPLWRAFGQRLRSGQAAEEVLLSLDPQRQVEVCRAWAEQPSLRPVTFEWLARLGASEDPDVRRAVVALRSDLALRPDLEPWLRSYASASPAAPTIP